MCVSSISNSANNQYRTNSSLCRTPDTFWYGKETLEELESRIALISRVIAKNIQYYIFFGNSEIRAKVGIWILKREFEAVWDTETRTEPGFKYLKSFHCSIQTSTYNWVKSSSYFHIPYTVPLTIISQS